MTYNSEYSVKDAHVKLIQRDRDGNIIYDSDMSDKNWVSPFAPIPNPVTAPPHYTDGGIETIDYLRAKLTPDEFKGFCKGNALKYISRAGKKGEAKQDYEKAKWYLDKLIETI